MFDFSQEPLSTGIRMHSMLNYNNCGTGIIGPLATALSNNSVHVQCKYELFFIAEYSCSIIKLHNCSLVLGSVAATIIAEMLPQAWRRRSPWESGRSSVWSAMQTLWTRMSLKTRMTRTRVQFAKAVSGMTLQYMCTIFNIELTENQPGCADDILQILEQENSGSHLDPKATPHNELGMWHPHLSSGIHY